MIADGRVSGKKEVLFIMYHTYIIIYKFSKFRLLSIDNLMNQVTPVFLQRTTNSCGRTQLRYKR